MLSIVLRQSGTNFTAHQRILCVLSSLATCLAINAIFYGMTFEAPATESATVLFVTIVAAIVPMLGNLWFSKGRHKQEIHTSRKQEKLIEANKGLERINYYVGCYFCCCCNRDFTGSRESDKIEKFNGKLESINPMRSSNARISRQSTETLKAIGVSIKKTFTPYSHEDAYMFKDEKMERMIDRIVGIGMKDNPFITIHDIFNHFDRDGSRHITRDELKEALCFLQQNHD